MSDASDPVRLAAELAETSARRIVGRALELFGDQIAIAFSGAEDVLLLEYAKQSDRPFRVFVLDTGRLHPETYRFFRRVEAHYDLRIEYRFPNAGAVETLVNEKGLFSFYDDGHTQCCGIRKVEPLRRQLSELRAWITGQRQDQSPARQAVERVGVDPRHTGLDGAPLVKFNPLAHMSRNEVWAAINAFDVPFNSLHEKGFVSIGCEPCTRAVLPHEHERAGRWWWEDETLKECGLHRPETEDPG